ncbi:myelin protein zero-like protein 2 isoform X2 [Electrophorus electricus]|uniref:myelin protein zero-like protein 2 isoform X2 n=1 Tax=Electrophorus electricus TaxID=8005 RepID=UPI0015D06EC7|nr:myelin protein zero-like protein 2 isoform X2 [Electrophorus electricus]
MCVKRSLLLVLLGLNALGWLGVGAMRVYTSGRVEAVNGTDVRLKCTFQSSHPIQSITISWSFRPLGQGPVESVFYYYERPYLPTEGRFRKKVSWVGDISSWDASIIVRSVLFSYNGTFSCQVKNPPDVHGNVGEVQLRVVTTASFSEIVILTVAIGGAVLLIIIVLITVMFVRRCRNAEQMECERTTLRRDQKDLVVW